MRFLVTGGTGFIGSHVVELILARGWEAVCPVRNRATLRNLEGLSAVTVSADRLEQEIEGNPELDYVIHVAGATRALDYDGYYEANVEMTRRLLELLAGSRARDTLKRFVLVSSQTATGPSPDDGTCRSESDPLCPVSNYGRSKAEAEAVVRSFRDLLPITIIRPPTVFGPRDVDVLGVFKCVRFRLAPCIAGRDRLVSIVYVEDLVEGILAAALSPAAVGETYFLANPEPVVWREFGLLVAKVMGYRALPLKIPLSAMKVTAWAGDLIGRITGSAQLFRSEKVEEMGHVAWVCSADKACRDFQWQPRTPMVEAVKKTADWYESHGWL